MPLLPPKFVEINELCFFRFRKTYYMGFSRNGSVLNGTKQLPEGFLTGHLYYLYGLAPFTLRE